MHVPQNPLTSPVLVVVEKLGRDVLEVCDIWRAALPMHIDILQGRVLLLIHFPLRLVRGSWHVRPVVDFEVLDATEWTLGLDIPRTTAPEAGHDLDDRMDSEEDDDEYDISGSVRCEIDEGGVSDEDN